MKKKSVFLTSSILFLITFLLPALVLGYVEFGAGGVLEKVEPGFEIIN